MEFRPFGKLTFSEPAGAITHGWPGNTGKDEKHSSKIKPEYRPEGIARDLYLFRPQIAKGNEHYCQQHHRSMFHEEKAAGGIFHRFHGKNYSGADGVENQSGKELQMTGDKGKERNFPGLSIKHMASGPFSDCLEKGKQDSNENNPAKAGMKVYKKWVHVD